MYRALVRNLLQARTLLISQVTLERDSAFDAMDESFLRVALLAIFRMNSPLAETHCHSLY